MVRLVKGAYWDTEVKRAQVEGLERFAVFTRKPATDVSFIANVRKLLSTRDHIYPQFATHNAHTVASVLDMAASMGVDASEFEFQRLHGMGETLHDMVMAEHGTRCRIYAPIGAHRDLLTYLVRRLLENGAIRALSTGLSTRRCRQRRSPPIRSRRSETRPGSRRAPTSSCRCARMRRAGT